MVLQQVRQASSLGVNSIAKSHFHCHLRSLAFNFLFSSKASSSPLGLGRVRSFTSGLSAVNSLHPTGRAFIPPLSTIKPRPAPDTQSFRISSEVRDALLTGKPVLALESTIYTHGYPHPQNLELANELEQLVRSAGVVPATIGILDGVAVVGLSKKELESLTLPANAKRTLKLSRRDLAYSCSVQVGNRKFNGGTTIASTMILAHRAGIQVFATGGLGGVHRGGEKSMDISADLTELGRTPVAVISSGCKSFLDIPRTLEYLETQGVAVATFCDITESTSVSGHDQPFPPPTDFPAFWSRESGVKSPMVISSEADAAKMIMVQYELGIQSGLLFANPIPQEFEIPFVEMEAIIRTAVEEAKEKGIRGKENTPYVLKRIRELTKGKSVDVNGHLIRSNVKRGSVVAKELAKMQGDWDRSPHSTGAFNPHFGASQKGQDNFNKSASFPSRMPLPYPKVIVAGGLAIDYTCDLTSNRPRLRSSNPARITQSLGGVGHNVARAAHLILGDNGAGHDSGSTVLLCSVVADDLAGRAALDKLARSGMRTDGIFQLSSGHADGKGQPEMEGVRTAQYVAINNTSKDLHLGLADMSILEDDRLEIAFRTWWRPDPESGSVKTRPEWLVVDANWPAEHLARWIGWANEGGVKVAYEPVSVPKAKRLMEALHSLQSQRNNGGGDNSAILLHPDHKIHLMTPNRDELSALHSSLDVVSAGGGQTLGSSGDSDLRNREGEKGTAEQDKFPFSGSGRVAEMCADLLPFCRMIVVTLGAEGVFVAMSTEAANDGGAVRNTRAASERVSPSWHTDRQPRIYMRHFGPAEMDQAEIVSVNGAGDTLLGGLVASFVHQSAQARKRQGSGPGPGPGRVLPSESELEDSVRVGQVAATMSLRSRDAVPDSLAGLMGRLQRR